MACRSQQRVAPEANTQAVSWNGGPESIQGSVMAENMSGTQSTYSLAPALRLPKVKSAAPSAYAQPLSVIDDFGLPEFTAVASSFGYERYGYVVTPNVDHLIRYYEDPTFRAQYRAADFILMDRPFAARLSRRLTGVGQ